MDEHVVCIRQHETLTRFEKLWNGKCIAIEGKLLSPSICYSLILIYTTNNCKTGICITIIWGTCSFKKRCKTMLAPFIVRLCGGILKN